MFPEINNNIIIINSSKTLYIINNNNINCLSLVFLSLKWFRSSYIFHYVTILILLNYVYGIRMSFTGSRWSWGMFVGFYRLSNWLYFYSIFRWFWLFSIGSYCAVTGLPVMISLRPVPKSLCNEKVSFVTDANISYYNNLSCANLSWKVHGKLYLDLAEPFTA